MIPPCLNPGCDTGDPVRSFLNPFYCSAACELAHGVLLLAGPPRREDVVRVPVQDQYARVAESYRRLWEDVQQSARDAEREAADQMAVKETIQASIATAARGAREALLPHPGLLARAIKKVIG